MCLIPLKTAPVGFNVSVGVPHSTVDREQDGVP